MSHVLHAYDGLCSNIHGHSYRLFVSVLGEPLNQKDNPKDGMVMDFGILKEIVYKEIVQRLDHALVVPKSSIMLSHLKNCDTKLVITDYQPTCENLLIDFAKRIKAKLPENVSLARLCLYETASSYAEWLAEDNEL